MNIATGLCVLSAVALPLSLFLLHAKLVQSSSLAFEYEDKTEAAVKEHSYGVAWCRNPTATKSQGQRYLMDPSFEISVVETQ